MTPGTLWAEMSTTDESEIRRLAASVESLGGRAVDCPVSGGCHHAATMVDDEPEARGREVVPRGRT